MLLISSALCPLGRLLAQSSSHFLLIRLTLLSSSYFSAYLVLSTFIFLSLQYQQKPEVRLMFQALAFAVCTTQFYRRHRKQVGLHHRTDEEADAAPVMKRLHS